MPIASRIGPSVCATSVSRFVRPWLTMRTGTTRSGSGTDSRGLGAIVSETSWTTLLTWLIDPAWSSFSHLSLAMMFVSRFGSSLASELSWPPSS